MRSMKRDLAELSALSAMVLAFALAAGAARAQDQAQPQQQQQQDQAQPQPQQQQDQSKAKTFTGTIIKNGGDYALRDSSGKMFKLDDTDRAKPFEGNAAKVTGQLDEQAMVIHVESIEGSEA